MLFDRYGSAWLLPITSTTYVGAFVGLAFSSTYGQFMGCLSVAGIAAAGPTTVAFSVVSQWFDVREGLAVGCVTVGAAAGGIFFSLVLQALFDHLAWQPAILALSGIILTFMTLANLLVETNRAPSPPQRASADATAAAAYQDWNLDVVTAMLRSAKFWLVCYAIFAYEVVLFIQWGSIPSYAVVVGFGANKSYLMVSYNIGAIFGRTVPPWLSDRKLGPLNAIILMNMFTLLVVLVVWLPFGDSSIAGLFVVTVLMGIGTGSFVPLGVACVSALCEPGTLGTWLGSTYTIVGFATLIGNPTTEAILARSPTYGLVVFLAAMLLSGLFSAVALRWLSLKRRWIFRQKI
ncbi:major facilitator superfamily domain-containing protein [Podospora appendiculata]|uniref:Major facilitator superfamily domain-containing protein n=1 Tax=Podospora appendiculata TaxID=314037 RepID=A0AAE0XL90_9PEZI|nr:major facilitator superfamily domain-containing protein [Podospora appendiculata]